MAVVPVSYTHLPGAVTDLFVNQIKLSGNIDNTNAMRYSGLSAHLSFEAEAIQKVGAESAILSEWAVSYTHLVKLQL